MLAEETDNVDKSEIKTKEGNQDLEENIKVAEELVETINKRTEIRY